MTELLRVQLRVDVQPGKGGFEWRVVALKGSPHWGSTLDLLVDHVLASGTSHDPDKALADGKAALCREAFSPVPARHEWECTCGVQLVIEARRSRRSPYSWDSPREVICGCGRSWGVKLGFVPGQPVPVVEALAR